MLQAYTKPLLLLNTPKLKQRFIDNAANPVAPSVFLVRVERNFPGQFRLSLFSQVLKSEPYLLVRAKESYIWEYNSHNRYHLDKLQFFHTYPIRLASNPLFVLSMQVQEQLASCPDLSDLPAATTRQRLLCVQEELLPYMSSWYDHLYP